MAAAAAASVLGLVCTPRRRGRGGRSPCSVRAMSVHPDGEAGAAEAINPTELTAKTVGLSAGQLAAAGFLSAGQLAAAGFFSELAAACPRALLRSRVALGGLSRGPGALSAAQCENSKP